MEARRKADPSLRVRAGDVSGAYYATRSSGYLRLPAEWPSGLGNFQPKEIVRSNCAMPGSRLASGLFLTQLDNLLTSFPRRYGTIRVGDSFVGCNYSDDLLGIGTPEAWSLLHQQISQQYTIEFEDGYPKRWVGMDFTMIDGTLHVGCLTSCDRYENPETYLPRREDFAALSPADKSEDQDAVSNARKWVGRLNYAATLHPALTYSAVFLSSALHYLPVEATVLAKRLMHAVSKHNPTFPVHPVDGLFCVIYTDASQNITTCRATAGILMQIQDTDSPEPLHNPIFWTSRRLASLYNSSYAAESKGLSEACAVLAQHEAQIRQIWPHIKFVMMNDNKALCESIVNRGAPHPFASNIIDFVKEKLNAYDCQLKWIRTSDNLADQLTKFKRFW